MSCPEADGLTKLVVHFFSLGAMILFLLLLQAAYLQRHLHLPLLLCRSLASSASAGRAYAWESEAQGEQSTAPQGHANPQDQQPQVEQPHSLGRRRSKR